MANERTDRIEIRIPKDVKEVLDEVAKSQNKTRTEIVRAGIADQVEKAKKK